jgi:hypothetical protein
VCLFDLKNNSKIALFYKDDHIQYHVFLGISLRVSSEVNFWNSAEVGIFSQLIYASGEFTELRGQNSAEFSGIPRNSGVKLHSIPTEIPVFHENLEKWKHGDMETLRHKNMKTLKQGEMETSRHCNIETW